MNQDRIHNSMKGIATVKDVKHKDCNGAIDAVYGVPTMIHFSLFADEGQIADDGANDYEWAGGLTYEDDLTLSHYECDRCGKRWTEDIGCVEKMPAEWEAAEDDH